MTSQVILRLNHLIDPDILTDINDVSTNIGVSNCEVVEQALYDQNTNSMEGHPKLMKSIDSLIADHSMYPSEHEFNVEVTGDRVQVILTMDRDIYRRHVDEM